MMLLEMSIEMKILLLALHLLKKYGYEWYPFIGKNRLIKMSFVGNIFLCLYDVYNVSIHSIKLEKKNTDLNENTKLHIIFTIKEKYV